MASLLIDVFESALDAIITVDQQQKIVLFNHAAEAMFGWTRQDVMQQPFEKLIAPRFRLAHAGQLAALDTTHATARRRECLTLGVCAAEAP